jgi:hypothetical protein
VAIGLGADGSRDPRGKDCATGPRTTTDEALLGGQRRHKSCLASVVEDGLLHVRFPSIVTRWQGLGPDMLHGRGEGSGERKGTSRISMTHAKRSLLGVYALAST